jgi:hypothetical protein
MNKFVAVQEDTSRLLTELRAGTVMKLSWLRLSSIACHLTRVVCVGCSGVGFEDQRRISVLVKLALWCRARVGNRSYALSENR